MAESREEPPQGSSEQSVPAANPAATNSDGDRSVRNESIAAANISDQASESDLLGFTPYVEAIAEFLTNEKTEPPLTLSVEGGWGSGKSSFMKQLQEEIKQLQRQKNQPEPKMVWFNAWRHDKVEALWAAFALEFLRQISTPRSRAEVIPTWRGHWKLFWRRLQWQENWQDLARILFLGLFFGSLALTIPVLFLTVGVPGINAFSNQVLCRLSPPKESNPTPEAANQLEACLASDPSSANPLESILNLLLILAGLGGSATGALALLLKLGEIVGDPKNDLKQYLEHPDYGSQVAFIEQFHEDFKKIVTAYAGKGNTAYAGKGNKVYVFIDDLDRCELTKAADLMQGLNLMISDDPHLIFILGMDREKVAAGIALKQKDILPYLPSSSVVLDTATQDSRASSKGLEYGYAFIEKFIQLPFQVPQASDEHFRSFMEAMSSPKLYLAEFLYKFQRESYNFQQRKSSIPEGDKVENEVSEGILKDLYDFFHKMDEEKLVPIILLLLLENGDELYCLLTLVKLDCDGELPGFIDQIRRTTKEKIDSSRKSLNKTFKRITLKKNIERFKNVFCQNVERTYLDLLITFDQKRGSRQLIRYLNRSQSFNSQLEQQDSVANSAQSTAAPTSSNQSTQDKYIRRETVKFQVTGDSQTVRDIVLMVAPALDHNPRRIKQFINLFRLKVFIASNTGLFDEVKLKETEQALPPLTLEQLGKFTALCMKYPLLRVDLAKDDKLREHPTFV
jgi:hypothetical protein